MTENYGEVSPGFKDDTGAWSVTSAPETFPEPSKGKATRWVLMTPTKEPVGTLIFNGGGVDWQPTAGASLQAQAFQAELLQFLRDSFALGLSVTDAMTGTDPQQASVQVQYAGDIDASEIDYTPPAK